MKKFVLGLVLGSLITGTVGAAAQYILTPITYDITVNGKSLQDEQYPMLNLDGTTYLSLRKTAEAFGATLFWNEATKTAELTTNQNTSSIEVTSSGMVAMKSDVFTLREEPIKYVIYDNEYYIEISAFAPQYLTADANNCYIKIPYKADLTLPKEPGNDILKTSDTVIIYLNSTYVRLADLNLTTELKDNVLWLK